jgi:hypothetical protein
MEPAVAAPPPPPLPKRRPRFALITLLLLAVAFGAGYLPEHLAKRRLNEQLEKLTFDHELSELHRRLGVASGEAMRNNYASAATAAQEFFNGCTKVLQSHAFENQPRTKNAITSYAASRDEVMAQLATGDPASRERLAGMFLAMDGVLARRE